MQIRRTVAMTILVGAPLLAAAPAWADAAGPHATYPPTQPTVLPTSAQRPVPAEVSPTSSSLPFTGQEIALMTVAGAATVAAGGVLVVAARRRRAAAPDGAGGHTRG